MFDNSQLASEKLAIDVVHDGRHVLGNNPLARESIPFIVVLPEQKIAFFTYTWVSKDSVAGAAICIFGPGVGPKPLQQRLADRPVPKDMDFDRWSIDGFRMEQDLRFNKAHVRWESPEVTVDFDFESSHPPYAYNSDVRGCPSYVADDRIEQAGRVTGTLNMGGRVIAFDGTGHRDHSWGTRDWAAMQQYEWCVGQVGSEIAVHFWRLQALGQTQVRGYVFKDGKLALIDAIEAQVDYDAQFWQQRYTATLSDSLGRKTSIQAEVFAHGTLVPDPCITLRESGGAATFDGKRGVAWMECAWPTTYLDHIVKNGPY